MTIHEGDFSPHTPSEDMPRPEVVNHAGNLPIEQGGERPVPGSLSIRESDAMPPIPDTVPVDLHEVPQGTRKKGILIATGIALSATVAGIMVAMSSHKGGNSAKTAVSPTVTTGLDSGSVSNSVAPSETASAESNPAGNFDLTTLPVGIVKGPETFDIHWYGKTVTEPKLPDPTSPAFTKAVVELLACAWSLNRNDPTQSADYLQCRDALAGNEPVMQAFIDSENDYFRADPNSGQTLLFDTKAEPATFDQDPLDNGNKGKYSLHVNTNGTTGLYERTIVYPQLNKESYQNPLFRDAQAIALGKTSQFRQLDFTGIARSDRQGFELVYLSVDKP